MPDRGHQEPSDLIGIHVRGSQKGTAQEQAKAGTQAGGVHGFRAAGGLKSENFLRCAALQGSPRRDLCAASRMARIAPCMAEICTLLRSAPTLCSFAPACQTHTHPLTSAPLPRLSAHSLAMRFGNRACGNAVHARAKGVDVNLIASTVAGGGKQGHRSTHRQARRGGEAHGLARVIGAAQGQALPAAMQ